MHAESFLADDLPPIVQRALSRIAHPGYFVSLNPVERFALGQLVRRVDATLVSEIVWCKRSNFAKLLAVSEATVYRLLAKLEGQGLIVREDQTRSQSGALSVAAIRFTASTLTLLGFTNKRPETLYSKDSPSGRLAPVQDPNQELKKQSATRKQSTETSQKIPEDLKELQDSRGLSTPQIFMLMGFASRMSTRLSDIWSMVKTKVPDQLRTKAFFAYLRKLITTAKDWTFLAKKAAVENGESLKKAEHASRMSELYKNQAGKQFQWGEITIEACPTGAGFLSCSDSTRSWSAPPGSEMAVKFWTQLYESHQQSKD